jgi:hypothetical protein
MPRVIKIEEFSFTIAIASLCGIPLILMLLSGATGECGSLEQPPASIEPAPVAPGPLPRPQEQILTPIPRQFDWMRREVRPNPILESLLRLREVTPHLLMSISLIEEYSDNFFLTERDPQEVYRTSINLGTVYRMESRNGFISLANSIRGSYDAGAGQGSFAFANLALNAGYQLPRLSLSLSESFIRSDEPEEFTPAGVQRQRRPFSQNIVSPQILYALTPTTALNGAYTNTLVWNGSVEQDNTDTSAGNQGGVAGNSVSHAFSVGLQHRFTRDLSGGASYTFTMTDSEQVPDTQSQAASADLAYIINSRTTASFRAFGMLIDQSQGTSDGSTSETDARVFGTTFGVRRQLTTSLAAFVAVGSTLVNREHRPTRVFANWQVDLDGALPSLRRTSLSFSAQQNIHDTAEDIDDVGLVLSQSATLTLSHSVFRDLLASVFANFSREQLLEDIATGVSTQAQDFTLWSAGVRLSYALSRIWSISGTYRYQHRDSDVPESNVDRTGLGGKYSENRVIFSLTAAFPIF